MLSCEPGLISWMRQGIIRLRQDVVILKKLIGIRQKLKAKLKISVVLPHRDRRVLVFSQISALQLIQVFEKELEDHLLMSVRL